MIFHPSTLDAALRSCDISYTSYDTIDPSILSDSFTPELGVNDARRLVHLKRNYKKPNGILKSTSKLPVQVHGSSPTSTITKHTTSTPTTIQLKVGKIHRALVENAVGVLFKHRKYAIGRMARVNGELPLLKSNNAVPIQVKIGLQSPFPIEPMRIQIPHSLYELPSMNGQEINSTLLLDEATICVIVLDESTKSSILETVVQFPQGMQRGLKVITLYSLFTKYYKHCKTFLNQYTHLITDDRIVSSISTIFKQDLKQVRKQPIPFTVTHDTTNLLRTISRAVISATYLSISTDKTCVTAHCGCTSQSMDSVVDNIMTICEQLSVKVAKGNRTKPRSSSSRCFNRKKSKIPLWANISSICVQLPNSISLPIYDRTPSEFIEIAEMTGISSIWVDDKTDRNKEKERNTTKDKKKRSHVDMMEEELNMNKKVRFDDREIISCW